MSLFDNPDTRFRRIEFLDQAVDRGMLTWGLNDAGGDVWYQFIFVTEENINNQAVRLVLTNFMFIMDGDWEIYFGE